MIASSIACTPLFLNAEPHMHDADLVADRARAQALLDLLVGQVAVLRDTCSAARRCLRRRPRSSSRATRRTPRACSAGISRYSNFVPWVASSHQISFMRIRSTTPTNLSSAPIGSWIGTATPRRRVLDLLDAAQEVGAGAVHLVDERDARHLVLFICRQTVSDCGCTPATAQNTATALSSTRRLRSTSIVKSTWPGRVDDVDAVLGEVVLHPLPEAGGRRGGDRDAALLLLLHVVHDGRAVVHFADLVRYARVEKDALGRRRLPRVDVRRDADVPIALDGRSTWHGDGLFGWSLMGLAPHRLYQR